MPALIQVNGKVSWGQIGAGYVGLLCLGSACMAMGTFGSAIAKNQLFAAIIGGFLVVLFLLGWLLSSKTETPFKEVFSYGALYQGHFEPFKRGRINTESLIYFASITFGFLLLSTRTLQSRRQS
jgi:ABC-2 type transport system permease protein